MKTRRWVGIVMLLALVAGACGDSADESSSSSGQTGGSTDGGSTIKVGILHSFSGTMAISEVSVRDAELLAIEEINAKGGVLGKKIEAIPGHGVPEGPGQDQDLPGRKRLRVPPDGEQGDQGLRRGHAITIVGEEYTPLGHTEYSTVVDKLKGRQARRRVQHAER